MVLKDDHWKVGDMEYAPRETGGGSSIQINDRSATEEQDRDQGEEQGLPDKRATSVVSLLRACVDSGWTPNYCRELNNHIGWQELVWRSEPHE